MRRVLFFVLVIGCAITFASLDAFAADRARFNSILVGDDNSANIRLVDAMRLLVAPLDDFGELVLGTGTGVSARLVDVMAANYQATLRPTFARRIYLCQGYARLGRAISVHAASRILVSIPHVRWSVDGPLVVMFFLFHFAAAEYFTSDFWAVLALIVFIRGKAPEIERLENLDVRTRIHA